MARRIHFVAIWLITIALACLYGIIHDQFTIRVSPEYFTKFHDPLIESQDLTLIALAWGIAATWWMGAFGGLLIALCAIRQDFCPRRFLVIAVRALAICMALAFATGIAAYIANYRADFAATYTKGEESIRRFSAVYATHTASYLLGTIAILALCFVVARPPKRPVASLSMD